MLAQVNEKDVADILIFSEIILKDIYDYLANSQTIDNIVLDDVILSNWGTIDEPYKAYYGTVSASMIGNWHQLYGNRLFAKNIRYYKGSTEVNRGIKDVLKTEPDKFFYYNNGIKMLCQKITRKAAYSTDKSMGLFVLEGVSLVNGAQTTGVIGMLYAEKPETVESAKVFIQMVELGDAGEEQATQITKFTNTQNRIESKDFAALDPVQERIKRELSFANIQYLYKAGARVDDKTHQIALDEAIIAQACSMDDLTIVATAKGNVGALTENIDKAPYKLLFNGGTNSYQLVNNVRVLRAVDAFLKRKEISATGRKRLVLVHGNRFMLHMALSELKSEANYDTSFLDTEIIETRTLDICGKLWEKIYIAQESKYPEAYPAHIYKNSGRIRTLKEEINKASENV